MLALQTRPLRRGHSLVVVRFGLKSRSLSAIDSGNLSMKDISKNHLLTLVSCYLQIGSLASDFCIEQCFILIIKVHITLCLTENHP